MHIRRVLALVATLLAGIGAASRADAQTRDALAAEIRRIGERTGGTLTVAALHLESGEPLSVDGATPVFMSSVVKLPLAVQLLARVDRGELHRRAISESDNTASDALLRYSGGPERATAELGRLGVQGVRIDRYYTGYSTDYVGAPVPPRERWSRALRHARPLRARSASRLRGPTLPRRFARPSVGTCHGLAPREAPPRDAPWPWERGAPPAIHDRVAQPGDASGRRRAGGDAGRAQDGHVGRVARRVHRDQRRRPRHAATSPWRSWSAGRRGPRPPSIPPWPT